MLLQFHHHHYHRNNKIGSSTFNEIVFTKRRRKSLVFLKPVNAVENDSEFEIDRKKKAQEALKQLDNQLQSLTTTTPPPNIRRVSSSRPSNLDSKADIDRDMMREPPPEYSDSFFGYSAFVLLFISVFYNILFLTVIKPSIDGPAPAAYTYVNTNQAVKEAPIDSPPIGNPE
ncbi:uncharacterized protein LOC113328951 [Papaver somniferum]|uniref:uncharacterized protein LOC113328951 n=1 Tax=Papaver somniferum TaxID=3469 RepID=UPI000E6F65C0|nr:uncharacterized protein LOC113328951 [Papaver somniferum]